MAKTSRDARKQIESLSRLFSGEGEVKSIAVENYLKKNKKRKYLKQSLRRLIEKGFLSENDKNLTPTLKGFRLFRKFWPTNKLPEEKLKHWDKKWRLISFDVPGRQNSKRDRIRSLLKEFDFYQLQKSVWICPNFVSKNLWKTLVDCELDKYCKTMIVDVIEGDEEFKRHFKLFD